MREQIENGISSQLSAFEIPRHPLENAGHTLGQFSEADQAFLAGLGENYAEPDDFQLETYTEADLIEKENQSGGQVVEGKGEIIEFERPDFTLEKCLARFMLVEGKTDVWDSFKKKTIKAFLLHLLG